MSNRDPFADKASPFGKQRPGSESQPPKTPTAPVTPSFPQRPAQGGTVPLPQRPAFPATPAKPDADAPLPTQPQFAPPTFKPKADSPLKGSSDDLFPSASAETIEEEYLEDEDIVEGEETVEEAYEEIFGRPLVGSESDYLPLNSAEEDLYEKHMVASDSNAAMPSLYSLAADSDPDTRVYVASNPNTPIVLLERLAKDPDADVREGVMENENCPTPLYKNFVLDPDDFVVATWLDNPRTTAEMVNPLHETQNPFLALKLIESSLVPEMIKVRLKQVLI